MNKITSTIISAGIFAMFLLALFVCTKSPEKPEPNPFLGDPFNLSATLTDSGVVLVWNKVDYNTVQGYRVYRSEDDSLSFRSINHYFGKNDTTYFDGSIVRGRVYWYYVVAQTSSGLSSPDSLYKPRVITSLSLIINDDSTYTATREVDLTIFAYDADSMFIWNDNDSVSCAWEPYQTSKTWELSEGSGSKVVLMTVRYPDSAVSPIATDTILAYSVTDYSIIINGDSDTTKSYDVVLDLAANYATEMLISSEPTFAGRSWEAFAAEKQWNFADSGSIVLLKNGVNGLKGKQLDVFTPEPLSENKRVYAKFKSDFNVQTDSVYDDIVFAIRPGVVINNDSVYASRRDVVLALTADNADSILISNYSDFSDSVWEVFSTSKPWTLLTGDGAKTVYAKFKNNSGYESEVLSDDIEPLPMNPSILINNGDQYTAARICTLSLSANGYNLQIKIGVDDSTFGGVNWENYQSTRPCTLAAGEGIKTVYARFKNDFEIESNIINDQISPQPINPSILINNGDDSTAVRFVTLNISANGENLLMKISPEDSLFTDIDWENYSTSKPCTLSEDYENKIVYAMFKNDFEVLSDMISDAVFYAGYPPNQPALICPPQDTVFLEATDVTLQWSCTDPNDDSLTYDLYFGNSPDPPLFQSGLNQSEYDIGQIEINNSYYWKAVAKDGIDTTSSAVWSFNPPGVYLVGSYDTPDYAAGVYVSGGYAYVADWLSGLQVIDVSNPSSPVLAGSYDTPGNAYGVHVSGGYAYVADGVSGLQVVDVSDPSNPALAGSYNTPSDARDVYISGDYAYVGDWQSGLQVIDVSNPSGPTLAGSYDTPYYAYIVYVSGDYAYVADGSSGLQVIDVSNPSSPTLAGSYDTPGYAVGVYVSDSYAYVGDGGGSGLQVADVSNPSNPILAGSYNTAAWARGIYVSGSYAYVADSQSGLLVIDVSDPSNPTLAGSYDTPGEAWDVFISGSYAYVADGGSGLRILLFIPEP